MTTRAPAVLKTFIYLSRSPAYTAGCRFPTDYKAALPCRWNDPLQAFDHEDTDTCERMYILEKVIFLPVAPW